MQPQWDHDSGLWYLEVQGSGGVIYDLYELVPDDIVARDGDWIVHRSRQSQSPVFAEHSSRIGTVLEVCRARNPARPFDSPSVRDFQAEGFRRLRPCPDSVFWRGQVAGPDLNKSSERFEPSSDDWEGIPPDKEKSDNPQVMTIVICSRRLSKWSSEAISQRKAAREAAARAERERAAAETEADRQKRDEEKKRVEEARRREEQAKADAWLASRVLLPGDLVMNVRDEINPCLGRVEYAGVYQDRDGSWCFAVAADKLPTYADINYGDRPKERHWNDARGLKAMFMPYEGPPSPLGARLARVVALSGRPDPFLPIHGDQVSATIEFVGKEFSTEVGDGLDIVSAFEILSVKAPYRAGYADNDDADDEVGDSDDDGFRERPKSSRRVPQTLEDRYPDLFKYDHRTDDKILRSDLGHPWREYKWDSHDRKLIEAEERHRIEKNAKWDVRKKSLLHLMRVLRGDLSQYDPHELSGAAACNLALTESDLDKLAEFLRRECNCEVWTGYRRDEIAPEMLDRHVLLPDRLDKVFNIWRKYGGSGPLFMAATDHLITDNIEPRFVIEGLVQTDAITLLVGPAKLGKSTIAMQIAMSVASGEPFASLKTQGGAVAYLFGEGTEVSLRKQRADAGFASDKLLAINARNYNERDIGLAFDDALDDLEGRPGLRLLVVDALEAFIPNSSDPNAIHRITERLKAFSENTGAAVLLIHHDTKDVTAENATSARQVAAKAKGSGRIGNAARATITLHRKGENRVLTLVNTNIPLTVSRLLNALEFEVDYATGLWRALHEPVVGTGKAGPVPQRKASGTESKAEKSVATNSGDADAHEAAPVVNRLQAEVGRRLAYAGAKSLYNLKGKADLDGWTRVRCERAHRRAVELGLVEPT